MEIDIKKKRIIEDIQSLPTLPVIVMKILECVDDPYSSADDLKDIIINDIAISSKVLSLANSAYYGYTKEIVDITRAVVVLGIETIIDISLSVSLNSILTPTTNCVAVSLEELWKHSIATGEAARLCAGENLYPYKERAFLIGLIHDIGKIALYCFFPVEFNSAIENAQNEEQFIFDTENNEFGFSHNNAGTWLADKWNLPPTISVPILFHHQPQKAPDKFQKEAVLAHLSDYIVKISKIGNSGDNNKLPELSPVVYSTLKIDEEQLNNLSQKLTELEPKIDSFMRTVF
ncbi:HDOD domain-containing protein [candidate division KSB1 bacterium]